jgi:hypothetical protein
MELKIVKQGINKFQKINWLNLKSLLKQEQSNVSLKSKEEIEQL